MLAHAYLFVEVVSPPSGSEVGGIPNSGSFVSILLSQSLIFQYVAVGVVCHAEVECESKYSIP